MNKNYWIIGIFMLLSIGFVNAIGYSLTIPSIDVTDNSATLHTAIGASYVGSEILYNTTYTDGITDYNNLYYLNYTGYNGANISLTSLSKNTPYNFTMTVCMGPLCTNPRTATGTFTTSATPFISVWDTTKNSTGTIRNSSASNTINLQTYGLSDVTYNILIDWGDGIINTISSFDDPNAIHVYATPGIYTLTMNSSTPITGWAFSDQGDKLKIINITQWGDLAINLPAFHGCGNLYISATDAPTIIGGNLISTFQKASGLGNSTIGNWDVSGVSIFTTMFSSATTFNGNISAWDTHNAATFSNMFFNDTSFNQDISGWDVRNANTMTGMFSGATSFNQPLNSWNVSTVNQMNSMFQNAASFNQPLDNWNVYNNINVINMFSGATVFNQDISGWNTSKLTAGASGMFQNAKAFNQPIGTWDVHGINQMSNMFNGATAFNQPLNNWNIGNVASLSSMFANTGYNQPLNNWNTSKVTSMNAMFQNATSFNQPLNSWDTSKVISTGFANMFRSATAFNQSISNWNISGATSLGGMFLGATSFNQPLNWDTSRITIMTNVFDGTTSFNQDISTWNVASVIRFDFMFRNAVSFNQNISNWNTGKATSLVGMFTNATSFSQNLGNWNISAVTSMTGMFDGVTLSTANYDSLLLGWSGEAVKSNVVFSGGNSKYSTAGQVGRDILTGTYGWTITDGGLAIPSCTPNWIPSYTPSTCPDTSQWLITYIDLNNCNMTAPADNGTLISCTYIPPENHNQTFEGKTTTDLNTVANISAVENFTVATTGSAVQWTNTVDLANVTALTDVVQSAPTFLSVNIVAAPSLDTPAEVALTTITHGNDNPCQNFQLYYANGYFTNPQDIIANGQLVATGANVGGDCIDPSICTNVQCSNGVLTFTAQHFDGFAVGTLQTDTPTNNGLLQTRNLVYAGLALLAVLILVIVSWGLIQAVQSGTADFMAIAIIVIGGGIIIMVAYVIIYFVFIALGGT